MDTPARVAQVQDEHALVRVVDAIDNAWELCRSYFTDAIDVDFTSLAGGSPGHIPADALIDGWRTNLYPEKHSHHMRSNYRITLNGDEAEVFSKGYALNILAQPRGSDVWEVWATTPTRCAAARQAGAVRV